MKIFPLAANFSGKNFTIIGFALLSAVVVPWGKAIAQTAPPVLFDGTVTPACTIGTTTDGQLSLSSDGRTLSTSGGESRAGTVDVTCNTSVTVTIDDFSQVILGNETSLTIGSANVSAGDGEPIEIVNTGTRSLPLTGFTGTTEYPLGGGTIDGETFFIDVSVGDGQLIKAGAYKFTVQISLVPQ